MASPSINRFGEETGKPVTLQKFELQKIDGEDEVRAAMGALTEQRIIRDGLAAWKLVGKSKSFQTWVTIILALQVGRDFAMRTTKATAPMGRMYSKTMCAWCREHGFGDMKASIRSWALDLHENLAAITAWRASLPAKLQRRLRHPHAIVTRWRVSVAGREREHDLVKTARTAWKRFVMCVEALPASEALPLWQMAQNECAAHLVSQ